MGNWQTPCATHTAGINTPFASAEEQTGPETGQWALRKSFPSRDVPLVHRNHSSNPALDNQDRLLLPHRHFHTTHSCHVRNRHAKYNRRSTCNRPRAAPRWPTSQHCQRLASRCLRHSNTWAQLYTYPARIEHGKKYPAQCPADRSANRSSDRSFDPSPTFSTDRSADHSANLCMDRLASQLSPLTFDTAVTADVVIVVIDIDH